MLETDSEEKSSLEYGFALSSVKGLGNTRIKRLITHFGNVQIFFDTAPSHIAQLPSFNTALTARIQALSDDLLKVGVMARVAAVRIRVTPQTNTEKDDKF